ncbi:MAG: ATP-binding protein [bacterium]
MTPPNTQEPRARVHRIVRLDYLVRVTTYPLYFLLYGLHLWPRDVSRWVWVLLVWHLLLWPYVARFLAARSEDSKAAEFRNLLVDSFFIGLAVPFSGFSLWPCATGFLGINAGNVLNGGVKFAARGLVLFIAGVLVATALAGFHPDVMAGTLPTQLLSIAVLLAFTTVVSNTTFRQSQNIVQINRQVRRQNVQIEEKGVQLEERSHQLEKALYAAESANAAKSNFLANMSHELRTPLNSIIGFANILLRNTAQNLRTQDIKYLSRISVNGSHLLTLINGVLDLSKIDARQMQLELTSVDIAALLREAMSEMEPQAELRDVELVAEVPAVATLHTDRSRLKQIVLNLLSNAVKFTHGGRITLRLLTDPRSGLPTRIDVIDTGIGIPADRLHAVFDPFQQEDETTSRQYGGTGLGLTITRSLAHLMGWRIEATSEVGVGSTFSVVMSRDPAAVSATRSTLEMQAVGEHEQAMMGLANAPLRVLIIDDEADARTILTNQLEELGCDVISAASADEGIALAQRVKPDLITLDIMMPRKNGWDALRELKAHADVRDIPVVVVSVVANEKRGRLLGAVDFIDKPVLRDSLMGAIRRNVGKMGPPRVLLVHDKHTDLRRYKELTDPDILSLEIAGNIADAREMMRLSPRPIDLVVLDLSEWDNATAEWISDHNNDPLSASIRIVVVLSEALIETLSEPYELGATFLRRGHRFAADLGAIVGELRERKAS